MLDLTRKQSFPQTGVTEAARRPLCLTAIVASLLLMMMPFLTGCGGGEGGGDSSAGTTASLEWSPVQDPSVIAYFVHYGRQSPGQQGSCAYESSMHVHVASPSATITNLDPDTLYYFTVSAYNGLESACSSEVSTVTQDENGLQAEEGSRDERRRLERTPPNQPRPTTLDNISSCFNPDRSTKPLPCPRNAEHYPRH